MYVDLAGLARYKRDFDAWARGALLPKDAAAARVRTAKAGAVSFVPVQRTPLDVSVDFLFTETPPASGDKSPSNPSTIAGVDNVLIRRLNKNILSTNKTYPSSSVYNNVTFTYNADKSITINGTASATTQVWLSLGADKLYLFREKTYTFSGFKSSSQTGIRLIIAKGNEYRVINPTTTSATFSPLQSSVYGCFIEINNGAVIDNVTIYPQLELGSTATEYEPFVLDSCIVSLNGTYYGGTLDAASGVMTVTWAKGMISDNVVNIDETLSLTNTICCAVSTSFYHYGNMSDSENYLICDKFPSLYGNGDTEHIRGTGSPSNQSLYFNIYINKSRLDFSGAVDPANPTKAEKISAMNAWLRANPVAVYAKRFIPQTVQLTPTQILSLTQSSDYDPRVNTVYSDQQAVQVGYLKHPSAASADLRNALVSLGGGV